MTHDKRNSNRFLVGHRLVFQSMGSVQVAVVAGENNECIPLETGLTQRVQQSPDMVVHALCQARVRPTV